MIIMKIFKTLLASVLLVSACGQDGGWHSACGCAFTLTERDKARAQIVSLTGDKAAMRALIDHYTNSAIEDEAALWRERISDNEQFAADVRVASTRAKQKGLPSLSSSNVASWKRQAEHGDIPSIKQLIKYLGVVEMTDESYLWQKRLDGLELSAPEFGAVSVMVKKAEATRTWLEKATLIEAAYSKLDIITEKSPWLPEDSKLLARDEARLNIMVRSRYAVDKHSLSYSMCMAADVVERENPPNWAASMGDAYGCSYAKGKYGNES